MIRILVRLAVLALIGTAVMVAWVADVWGAPAVPDSMLIRSARMYGGVIVDGDMLLVVHYNLQYSSVPGELASQTFLVKLVDTTGPTTLGTAAPFSYVNNGYGDGITAVYFSLAQVTALGLTWGNATDYRTELIGNPSLFPSPPSVTLPAASLNWRAVSSSDDELTFDLLTHAQSIAHLLEARTEWIAANIALTQQTSAGEKLSANGEQYFTSAILNLRAMAPQLFDASVIAPDFSEAPKGSALADEYEGFFDGSVLDGAFEPMGEYLGIGTTFAQVLFILLLTAIVWWFIRRESGDKQEIAFLSIPIVWIPGAMLGLMPLQMIGIFGFLGILTIVFYFGWKKVAS